MTLPNITKQKIKKAFSKDKLEDIQTLKSVEKILVSKRGYVFKMPKSGSKVVFQISGGLDSVTTAAILMKEYGLVIYPVFIRRGQSRVKQEEASVDFFNRYFAKKYPKMWQTVYKLNTKIPPWEIRREIIKNASKKIRKNSEQRWGIPMYASLLTSYAVEYAIYLELSQGLKLRNIFCAAIESDAVQFSHHSLTGLRVIMLNICVQRNDFSWQFTSPLIEKEIGRYISKKDLVKWATSNDLPIHRTWSCYFRGIIHCGKCIGCGVRRDAFEIAGFQDKTLYKSDINFGNLKQKIKPFFPKFILKLFGKN